MCLEFETDSFRGDYHCPAFRGSSDSTVQKKSNAVGFVALRTMSNGGRWSAGKARRPAIGFPYYDASGRY